MVKKGRKNERSKRLLMVSYKRKKFGPPKRKRKPMTPEQKFAAAERLRLAREAKGPAKHKNIAKSVLELPDDHFLSLKKVRQWIKTQKGIASSERRNAHRNMKGAYAKQCAAEGYIRFMNHYIQHGDWPSNFYGEYEDKRITWKTIA